MSYIGIIQKNIDYIEENLKTEITADELAEHAGFSLFHYYRIFQQFIGMPVMQYIVRRRLAHAIFEVQCGRKMIDAALNYGFDTHAGFYKAFQREYDCSPTEYLRRAPARQPQKINLWQEEFIMITHKKLKEVAKNWDIEQPVTITDIFFGGNNIKADDTWYVNDQFVIKTGTNIGSLKRHLALSKAIKDAGLEAANPIPTRDGKDYVLDDEHYFFLSPKLYYDDVMKWALTGTKEQMKQHSCPLSDSFYDDYISTFGRLNKLLPRQIIHRNVCPGNFIMVAGKLTGFADFEFSERNVRLFDPCYCATGILSESINENNPEKLKKWPEIFTNILAGYNSVCNPTPEELKAVIYVVYSIQMICVAYFGKLDKFTELAGINRRMLSWIYESRERLYLPW